MQDIATVRVGSIMHVIVEATRFLCQEVWPANLGGISAEDEHPGSGETQSVKLCLAQRPCGWIATCYACIALSSSEKSPRQTPSRVTAMNARLTVFDLSPSRPESSPRASLN